MPTAKRQKVNQVMTPLSSFLSKQDPPKPTTEPVPTDAEIYAAIQTEQRTNAAMQAERTDDNVVAWCSAFRVLRQLQEARRNAIIRGAVEECQKRAVYEGTRYHKDWRGAL